MPHAVACGILIFLAPPRGIEPLTKSFEGSCSVQLSYGRVIRMPLASGFVAHHYRESASARQYLTLTTGMFDLTLTKGIFRQRIGCKPRRF